MRFRATALIAAALLTAGCGADEATTAPTAGPTSSVTPTTTPAQTPTPSTPPAERKPGTVVATADSEFGEVLFDGGGQVIYLFDKETTAKPECYDECAEEWPPVLTEGDPVPDSGAAPDLLGTTERTDGTTQVTYAGHPLYYYAHEGPNEILCHDVREFGGTWLVVTPSGDPAA